MISKLYYKLFPKLLYFYHHRFRKGKNALKDILLENNQNRWLDLGSSSSFTEGFYFADIVDITDLPIEMQSKYTKFDVSKPLTVEAKEQLGKFDFIRMQHVFEHFTFEDGVTVLENCNILLNEGGYLLISVPDLEIFLKRYYRKSLKINWTFTDWAKTRIPENAPQSCYFSIFSHSVLGQPHLWCYDTDGLIFQIKRSGKYSNIKKIRLFDKLCNIPFTHNRPLEDLCILAQKM